MASKNLDFLVIGAGPAGILAGIWIKRNLPHKRFEIVEKGRVANSLESVPNVKWHSPMVDLMLPSILNSLVDEAARPLTSELATYYREVADEHQLPIREQTEAVEVTKQAEDFIVTLRRLRDSATETLVARTVINCTGVLDSPAPADFSGAEFVKRSFDAQTSGMDILVTGSGASAVDLVTTLVPRNRVTWVRRSDSALSERVPEQVVRDFENTIDRHKGNFRIIEKESIREVSPDLRVVLTSGESLGPFSSVYALIGYESAKDRLLSTSDLSPDRRTLSFASPKTSQAGMFAFGSITQQPKSSGRLEGASVRKHILEELENLGNGIVENEVIRIFGEKPEIKHHFSHRLPGLVGIFSRRISRFALVMGIFQTIDRRLWFLRPNR